MNNSKVLETIMRMAVDDNQGVRMSTALVDAKKDPRGGLVTFGVEEDAMQDASVQLLGFPNKNIICCFFVNRDEFDKYSKNEQKHTSQICGMDKKHLPDYAGTFRTYSGKKMNVLAPAPEMIELIDIAKGLGYNSHFTGQTPDFFSIAEHCLLTEELIGKEYPEDYELRLVALLHDAAEAYIGDMIHPIKLLFPEFKTMENKLLLVIFEKFNIPIERLPEVKPFDLQAQDIEASAFYDEHNPQKQIQYLPPSRAGMSFENRVKRLLSEVQTSNKPTP